MSTYDIVAARRAAAALQTHIDEKAGFPSPAPLTPAALREAVIELMVDIKHLLVSANWTMMLTELAEEAVDRWGEEDE